MAFETGKNIRPGTYNLHNVEHKRGDVVKDIIHNFSPQILFN